MKYHSFALPGFLLSALLYCDAGNTARAEETYVLAKKNHVPAKGTSISKEFSMNMSDAAMKITAGGQEIAGSMTRLESNKETTEILSAEKIRLTATDRKVEGKMTINGQDQATPDEPEPLLNKPVVLDLKEGKWSASLEAADAKPTAAEQKSLDKKAESANKDADFGMYGDTPRKVGDEWKVDPSKTGFGEGTDLTGDYSVKFVEVKDYQGAKCAVLKATYDFKGKIASQPGSEGLGMRMKGEAVSIRSIADLQDLDVQIDATMTLDGAPAEGVSMNVEGPMKGSQKITLKKP